MRENFRLFYETQLFLDILEIYSKTEIVDDDFQRAEPSNFFLLASAGRAIACSGGLKA
jgi:hypothetical protein